MSYTEFIYIEAQYATGLILILWLELRLSTNYDTMLLKQKYVLRTNSIVQIFWMWYLKCDFIIHM